MVEIGEVYRTLVEAIEKVHGYMSGAKMLRSLNFLDLPRFTNSSSLQFNHNSYWS